MRIEQPCHILQSALSYTIERALNTPLLLIPLKVHTACFNRNRSLLVFAFAKNLFQFNFFMTEAVII